MKFLSSSIKNFAILSLKRHRRGCYWQYGKKHSYYALIWQNYTGLTGLTGFPSQKTHKELIATTCETCETC